MVSTLAFGRKNPRLRPSGGMPIAVACSGKSKFPMLDHVLSINVNIHENEEGFHPKHALMPHCE